MTTESQDAFFLSGAGNDFLALAEPDADPTPENIRAWCRRGLSLGADGLFRIDRASAGVRMRYWNADGSQGALCLNGSRCAAQLAFCLGWDADGTLNLVTDAGILEAQRRGATEVAVTLPAIVGRAEPKKLKLDGRTYDGWSLDVGVPHWVLPWPTGLADLPITTLGPRLRSHPDLGSSGANIDFVRYREGIGLDLRTFERGVEAETLACGTGVVAAVAVAATTGALRFPTGVATAGGFILTVDADLEGHRLLRTRVTGDARIVASCRLHAAAAHTPPRPRW